TKQEHLSVLLPAPCPALLSAARGVGYPLGPSLRSALHLSVASEGFDSLSRLRERERYQTAAEQAIRE
ncbi:hypothetical protein, partial [Ottowia thiooxydans]|uniref:hypothetical protein n=1 Tax=Ottowia thiooxydans TaxID=219182 RepID=UPI00055A0DCC